MFGNATRYIINFLLSGLIFLGFRQLGWVIFVSPPKFVETPWLNDLLIAAVIGLFIFIVGEILGFFFKIARTVLFFFGCLLSIIYFFVSGYIKLALVAAILPGWFDYSKELLVVIIMVSIIGWVRLPHHEELSKDEREFLNWKKQQRK